jgi:hypothetical protein
MNMLFRDVWRMGWGTEGGWIGKRRNKYEYPNGDFFWLFFLEYKSDILS